jgi:protein-S-isoprenylcysteine O-methyltransferase Ste14
LPEEVKMSLTPAFEIGFWNAWVCMIWVIVLPFLSGFIVKEKKVSKKLRTSAPMKYEKIFNVISMGAIIFGFIYSLFLPLKVNTIWFYIGLSLFLCGLIIDLAVLYIIRNADIDKPFTKGPYKYSRHPIYVALFLIIVSIGIMSLSWVFLFILIIVTTHLLIAVPAEEQYCLKTYGKEYRDYMGKTARWLGIPKHGVK